MFVESPSSMGCVMCIDSRGPSKVFYGEYNTIEELALQEIDEKGLGMLQDVRRVVESSSSMGMHRGY